MIRINAVVLGLLLTPAALADGEAEWEYRHAVMEAIGGHMVAMATILKKGVHKDDLALHARGIATLAEVAPDVFPEGSDVSKSESLPAVWESRAEFDAAMDEFVKAAQDMAAAAESGEMSQIGPAINALGGACKGCHDDFRQEH